MRYNDCMPATVNPQIQARVPEHIQRRGKAKAALMGLRFGEYLADLIERDTTTGLPERPAVDEKEKVTVK